MSVSTCTPYTEKVSWLLKINISIIVVVNFNYVSRIISSNLNMEERMRAYSWRKGLYFLRTSITPESVHDMNYLCSIY